MYRLERQAECGPVGEHPGPQQLGALRHLDGPEPSSGQPATREHHEEGEHVPAT